MKKIRLSENTFNAFKKCLIGEAIQPNPYLFGTRQEDYKQRLADLSKISNLRVDRYKDYDLENSFKEWANVSFDKSTNEYKAWCGQLKKYLDYLGSSIYYVLTDKVERVGDARPHYAFIDPVWVESVVHGKKEEHQGIYCLTLKIFQNKVVWNDLFFNPVFNDLKEAYMKIKSFVASQIAKNPNIKLLMPLDEYKEINKFINSNDAKPELFCNLNEEPNNEPQVDDTDDFDWG